MVNPINCRDGITSAESEFDISLLNSKGQKSVTYCILSGRRLLKEVIQVHSNCNDLARARAAYAAWVCNMTFFPH